jgi:hypothetical protein
MIIKVPCPDCGKIITIDVVKVDRLQVEIDRLRREVSRLKHQPDDMPDFLKDLFGGTR